MSQEGQWENLKKELCEILTRIGALKFGIFTLADGNLSPYYIDLRIVPSFPEAFVKVEKIYLELYKRDLDLGDVSRIAGIPTAGIPFAAVLSFSLNKPFLYVRRDQTHGRERKVEGILNPGEPVLIVDDLVMTGKTILAAADSIRYAGSEQPHKKIIVNKIIDVAAKFFIIVSFPKTI